MPCAVQSQGHGLCLQEHYYWVRLFWESLAVCLAGSCSPLPMHPGAVLSMDVGMPQLLSAWVVGLLSVSAFKPFLTLVWHHRHSSPFWGTQNSGGAVSPAVSLTKQTPSAPPDKLVLLRCYAEMPRGAAELSCEHGGPTAPNACPAL